MTPWDRELIAIKLFCYRGANVWFLGRFVGLGSADVCAAKSHVRFSPESGQMRCTRSCLLWANSGHRRHFLFTRCLANRFGDDPCPVAPFTGLIALIARLVYLLSGPMAVWADILAGARRAGFWIVLRSVMCWCLRRHCLPFCNSFELMATTLKPNKKCRH